MPDINELKFDEKGLIPAIVTDASTGRILTLAYMNRESLEITIREKRTCFWSRSRQELWRKGETSGNIQHLRAIVSDCDSDALIVYVDKKGPACHKGTESCFEYPVTGDRPCGFTMEELYGLLRDRKSKMPEGSYTTYLFEKGRDKILKKIGEEATEVVIAGKADDRANAVYELADLAYHVAVLMADMGISVEEIKKELESRHVIDKKTKQEKMIK